jgi:hypothetical protein
LDVPLRYNNFLAALRVSEVSYGCGGIKIFSAAEIDGGHVGYAVGADGTSFCDRDQGAWRPNWIVIGYETACGDPIFIDADDPTLPVFSAPHGEGVWNPEPVATSIDSFARSLVEFARIAERRGNPLERESNPLSNEERVAFL